MSRAEKFIQDCTRTCSNELLYDEKEIVGYEPWLTLDQARNAVEIAREEIYKWLENNIYMYNGECENDRTSIINDLKQAMEDETENL